MSEAGGKTRGEMKYWELCFLTAGAAGLIGGVITPRNWIAAAFGFFLSLWAGFSMNGGSAMSDGAVVYIIGSSLLAIFVFVGYYMGWIK